MEKSENDLERLLYEFSIILEQETDLRHLYFVTLPLIMIAFNLDMGVVFKYSRRKQCFDPKASLTKSNINEIRKKWYSSHKIGEFADYLLNMNIDELYETKFNKKIRDFNIPCNDISRSILSPFVIKSDRIIDIENIKNKYIVRVLGDIGMKTFLYSPLISENSTVGFILSSPVTSKTQELKIFRVGLSLAMNIFINDKDLSNMKQFIEINKEDIEHKQKLYEVGKTSSTITHEIKNSLIGIIGLFNKLKKHTDNSEKTKRYVDIIDSELSRMYRFAIDINKYSSNYTSSNKEVVDLKEIIDKAIDMTNNINNNFIFSVCVDKKASSIFADKNQLEQVLINIFKNSIEAYKKKDGGRINIRAKKERDFVILKVRDNSGGINDKELKEVMKPFYTTKSNGTGLGLSIIKEIINDHGGSIELRNVREGLECIIKLAIPRNIITEENDE